MKLIWIALFALGIPLLTWYLEERDPARWEAARMADRDRKAQMRRQSRSRGKYSQVIMPPLLAQRRHDQGQTKNDQFIITE